jgi:hypothetical protein
MKVPSEQEGEVIVRHLFVAAVVHFTSLSLTRRILSDFRVDCRRQDQCLDDEKRKLHGAAR